MTGHGWRVLYQVVLDGKIRIVDGHLVERQDAAEVLALYDHPRLTQVQRRNLGEHSFEELLDLARSWLAERSIATGVDPEGFVRESGEYLRID
jgi:hypothetical protein